MAKLLGFVGAIVGGYAGWALGEPLGFLWAFIISIVGTAIGGYYGRKIGRHYQGY